VLHRLNCDAHERCPWHPEIHGWDLQDILGRLCRAFVEELGKATTLCSVWHIDHEKEERFVYATCGADWAYLQNDHSLGHCGESVERVLRNGEPVTLALRRTDSPGFLDEAKARRHDISYGLFRPVIRLSGGSPEAIAGITVYFNPTTSTESDAARIAVAKEALPAFAEIIAQLIATYEKQRLDLAVAVCRAEEAQYGGCSIRTQLEVRMQRIVDICDSPAASIYAYDRRTDFLRCVASTGFRKEVEGVQDGTVSNRDMSFDGERIFVGDREGHTIAALLANGAAFHRNRLGYAGEKKLPPRCPERGGTSRPEFIPGENIAESEHSRRRFLGCAVMKENIPLGVLRVIRPEGAPPFTKCDDRLLQCICKEIAPLLERRIDESIGAGVEGLTCSGTP
jgi:hypothetical protein